MIFWRFGLVYFLTAVIDNAVFWVALKLTGSALAALIIGRAASIPFNYFAVRTKVFASQARHEETAPKYILLYAAGFGMSYAMIRVFAALFQSVWPTAKTDYLIMAAKLIAEGLILIAKFFVQRYWIFRRPAAGD